MLPTLMVIDGETKATLGVTRGLEDRRIPLIVGSNGSLGRSGFSKHVQCRFDYSSPATCRTSAHPIIIQQIRTLCPDVLMPVMDDGWSVVYAHYEEYAALTTIVPNPGRELFENLFDKGYMADYAEQHGVAIPKTFRPPTLEDALALRDSLPYPVLLKPRKSTAGSGITRIDSPREFAEALTHIQDIPVIQEVIEGEDLELTLLCIHGEPVAGSAYVSIRNAPLPYGPPVACRTIRDEVLMGIGMDFLKKLRYHGVAHLDFRRDKRDGQPKLLDFNARLAGTNEVSLRSGIDFGFMLYQLACGEHVDPCFDYELDKEFRWIMPGELLHLVQTPHRMRTIRQLLRWHKVSTDISLSDPLPHVVMVIDGLRRLLKQVPKNSLNS